MAVTVQEALDLIKNHIPKTNYEVVPMECATGRI